MSKTSKSSSLTTSLDLDVIYNLNSTLSVPLIYLNYKLVINIRITWKVNYFTLTTSCLLFTSIY